MKKRIGLALAFVLLLALAFALASCGHKHAYKAEWEIDDTNHWRECHVEGEECGEVSEKAAHTLLVTSTTPATCDGMGTIVEACSVCGYEKATTVEPLGHDYNEEIIAPTCTAGGYTKLTCKREGCTNTISRDITSPADHTWLDATCKAPKTCSKCSATVGETLSHVLSEKVYPPTCTVDGRTEITCANCNYYEAKDKVPATGHTYDFVNGEYKIGLKPGCETEGEKNFRCTVCKTFPKDGDKNIEKIPATGHSFEEAVIPPTCDLDGLTEVTCANCDYYETKDIVSKLGHKYYMESDAVLGTHFDVIKEPTCTEKGETGYICTVCGKIATDATYITETAALGHNMVVVKGPWCGNGGVTEKECDRVCNGVECTSVEAVPSGKEYRHTYGTKEIAETCVDNATYSCTECHNSFVAYDGDAQGQATGKHSYTVKGETVASTCIARGYTIYACSNGNCGTTENRDYQPKTSHALGEVSSYGTVTCADCNRSFVDVTAEKIVGSDKMCLGCGKDPCVCEGVTADWEGYTEPQAPMAISANTSLIVTEVELSDGKHSLAIGKGVIMLYSDSAVNFTVTIYAAANGAVLHIFDLSGVGACIDLYEYEAVGKVVITADADASVSFFREI